MADYLTNKKHPTRENNQTHIQADIHGGIHAYIHAAGMSPVMHTDTSACAHADTHIYRRTGTHATGQ